MQKRYRLKKTWQFQRVRGEGLSWVHPLLVLYALPNGLDHSRVGFSVSKRVGNAVVRNRTKRRMREAIRLRWSSIASGWDLVLIARTAIPNVDYWRISRAIDKVLHNANLLQDSGLGRS